MASQVYLSCKPYPASRCLQYLNILTMQCASSFPWISHPFGVLHMLLFWRLSISRGIKSFDRSFTLGHLASWRPTLKKAVRYANKLVLSVSSTIDIFSFSSTASTSPPLTPSYKRLSPSTAMWSTPTTPAKGLPSSPTTTSRTPRRLVHLRCLLNFKLPPRNF